MVIIIIIVIVVVIIIVIVVVIIISGIGRGIVMEDLVGCKIFERGEFTMRNISISIRPVYRSIYHLKISKLSFRVIYRDEDFLEVVLMDWILQSAPLGCEDESIKMVKS